MRAVVPDGLQTLKRIPGHQDVCARVSQEVTQISSYVVIIFHNDNREITGAIE